MKKVLFGILGLVGLLLVLAVGDPKVMESIRNFELPSTLSAPVKPIADQQTGRSETKTQTPADSLVANELTESDTNPATAQPAASDVYNNTINIETKDNSELDEIRDLLQKLVDGQTGTGSNNIYIDINEPEETYDDWMPEEVYEDLLGWTEDLFVESEPVQQPVVEVPTTPTTYIDENDFFDVKDTVEVAPQITVPAITQAPVEYPQYYTPIASNKGLFVQSGLNLGGGYHRYSEDNSIILTTGIEFKVGAFISEHFGIFAFADPEYVSELVNVTTYVSLPNSVNVSAGAGFVFDFGKFGLEGQAGLSILNIGLREIKAYAFGTATITPEFNFIRSGKTSVKLVMPLTVHVSAGGYTAYGGLGLSVKVGGSSK